MLQFLCFAAGVVLQGFLCAIWSWLFSFGVLELVLVIGEELIEKGVVPLETFARVSINPHVVMSVFSLLCSRWVGEW